MKVLIINTAITGITGISNVIKNYTDHTKNIVSYEFVLNGIADLSTEQRFRSEYGNVYIPKFSRIKHPIMYMYWLKNLIAKNRYDVVHIHGNSGTMFFDVHAAHLAKIKKIIVHSHSSSCKYKLVHYLLKNQMNKELTDAIACSELAGDWLFTKPYTILPNGINVDKYKFNLQKRINIREKYKLDNSFVIGHVAYMDIVKNHLYFLDVFAKLLKQRPNSKLLLIGDGILRNTIEEKIQSLNLKNNVILLGRRKDVEDFYQAMDVFVLPSVYEGLPVTLIEAQTAGLHCIVSSNVSKQSDITGNVTFIPIRNEDIEDWVLNLSNSQHDDNRIKWADLIANSNFNIAYGAKQLLKIYGN